MDNLQDLLTNLSSIAQEGRAPSGDYDTFIEHSNMLDEAEKKYGPEAVRPMRQELKYLNPKWKEMRKLRDLEDRKDQLEFEQRNPEERSRRAIAATKDGYATSENELRKVNDLPESSIEAVGRMTRDYPGLGNLKPAFLEQMRKKEARDGDMTLSDWLVDFGMFN